MWLGVTRVSVLTCLVSLGEHIIAGDYFPLVQQLKQLLLIAAFGSG